MEKGTFVNYCGFVGVIVRDFADLTILHPDLDDHLGVWFGDKDDHGSPIVKTIPAEYVQSQSVVHPVYQH